MENGIKYQIEKVVTAEMTAAAMGSGTLQVLATPALIAMIEETAWRSVASFLEEGQTTVGTHIDISHTAPTPLGMTIVCETELIAIDGRKLTFLVKASDARGFITTGIHERFIVEAVKFQAKADAKAIMIEKRGNQAKMQQSKRK